MGVWLIIPGEYHGFMVSSMEKKFAKEKKSNNLGLLKFQTQ
jgi:hypothetical protein